MEQIPLDMALKEEATFANFVTGDNRELIGQLRNLAPETPGFIYLQGAASLGKSHLLQAVAHRFDKGAAIAYIPLADPVMQPAMLQGLEGFTLVCLDDLDAVAGVQEWEMALFNLYNGLKEEGGSLLVAARAAPAELPLQLPDLRSRLGAMLRYRLVELSDEGKMRVLQVNAARLGLTLEQRVARFLVERSERDLGSLLLLLAKLDQASLEAKRPLTLPFAKSVLDL